MSKAQQTRMMILNKAFELIYKKGFQATSIDEIIATTQVTKGAFFYHFKNKEEMGLGLINDILNPGMYSTFVGPLAKGTDPVQDIYQMMERLLLDEEFFDVAYGCPAINLIEEMSPLNDTFKKALSKLVLQWQQAIVQAVEKGKAAGKINRSVVAEEVAMVIQSGYGGVRNMGKVLGSGSYKTYLKGLKAYLSTL